MVVAIAYYNPSSSTVVYNYAELLTNFFWFHRRHVEKGPTLIMSTYLYTETDSSARPSYSAFVSTLRPFRLLIYSTLPSSYLGRISIIARYTTSPA